MAVHQRTCIGCRQVKAKKDLIKIVRSSSEKTITVDLHGKGKGRGAYICPNMRCINEAIEPERLNRAFRISQNSADNISLETIGELRQKLISLVSQLLLVL